MLCFGTFGAFFIASPSPGAGGGGGGASPPPPPPPPPAAGQPQFEAFPAPPVEPHRGDQHRARHRLATEVDGRVGLQPGPCGCAAGPTQASRILLRKMVG